VEGEADRERKELLENLAYVYQAAVVLSGLIAKSSELCRNGQLFHPFSQDITEDSN